MSTPVGGIPMIIRVSGGRVHALKGVEERTEFASSVEGGVSPIPAAEVEPRPLIQIDRVQMACASEYWRSAVSGRAQ